MDWIRRADACAAEGSELYALLAHHETRDRNVAADGYCRDSDGDTLVAGVQPRHSVDCNLRNAAILSGLRWAVRADLTRFRRTGQINPL